MNMSKIFALVSCLFMFTTGALAHDAAKPLTREEPIVRMLLQGAANEPLSGMLAVAGVVLDRVDDPRWPNTKGDVVYQPAQFQGMTKKLRKYTAAQLERARKAVTLAEAGQRICGKSFWYHPKQTNPKWHRTLQLRCGIGNLVFYGDMEQKAKPPVKHKSVTPEVLMVGEFKPITRAEVTVRMILQEAANEPLAGQVAAAGVALDRVKDRRWPSTIKKVIYQPAQFTGMHIGFRDYSKAQITQARLAVSLAESGTRPCGKLLWYHATQVDPSWHRVLSLKCQIGNHIFYGDLK